MIKYGYTFRVNITRGNITVIGREWSKWLEKKNLGFFSG